jgi:glycerophosphoryl diester phosphodiesterase
MIDITALAQDDYLLVHDATLEAETTGTGHVQAASVEQVRTLFMRDPRTKEATPYHTVLLSDVVALFNDFRQTNTRLQLDFKSVYPFANNEPIQRLIKLIEPLGERVIVSTGADWQLRRLRAAADWLDLGFDVQFYIDWREQGATVPPHVPPFYQGAYGYWDDHILAKQRLYATPEYLADRCATFVGLVPRLSTFYISHKILVQSLQDGFNWASELHRYGIKLDAWTLDVTNPTAVANAKLLLEAGVDQFTSNTPNELATLLAE